MKARPIRIVGDLAYVTLTRGYEAVIDSADVPLVDGFNWCALVHKNAVYARRADCSGIKQRAVYLHRVILGEPDGMDVDHRDGDGLNNRRNNLREATRSQNMCNQRISSRNTHGLKGVHWHKAAGKWQAHIKLNGRNRHLGLFTTPEAAYAAYCDASTRLHGDFGRTV